MSKDYQKEASDLLESWGMEFRAVLVGDDCPPFCEDARHERDMDKVTVFPRKTHIHGKHYRVTISKKGKGHFTIDFWNSYADEEENYFFRNFFKCETSNWDKYRISGKYPNRPKIKKAHAPTSYDVLACVQKYDPGTFEDFCSDFGYDEDSRRAEETYGAVCREWKKVEGFFTDAELEALREVQ